MYLIIHGVVWASGILWGYFAGMLVMAGLVVLFIVCYRKAKGLPACCCGGGGSASGNGAVVYEVNAEGGGGTVDVDLNADVNVQVDGGVQAVSF